MSSNGKELITEMRMILDNYRWETEKPAAASRGPMQRIEGAKIGAEVETTPLKSNKSWVNHPLTENGVQKYREDYKKGNK
jgi:Transaldolase